jgi:hypothetical protein
LFIQGREGFYFDREALKDGDEYRKAANDNNDTSDPNNAQEDN